MSNLDPWDDDWTSTSLTGASSNPGVVVVESKEQVRKLFAANDNQSTAPSNPMQYEVQTSLQGSQYKPQLRILKRPQQDSSSTPSLTSSSPDAEARPGESEADRLDRLRKEKEARYRAARERVFGTESTPTTISSQRQNSRSQKEVTKSKRLVESEGIGKKSQS
ncbi:uncharacterized protein V2V93DRAFT_362707 [Kockiozyma suomiensis]|uniref:uncharacterized protein n=1 Tax=Kockiozyma suomiensis TaxID=1337062 RepID=UPI0033440058